MITRKPGTRNGCVLRVSVIALAAVIGFTAVASAPVALADAPDESDESARLIALETRGLTLQLRAKIAGLDLATPTVTAPVPVAADAPGVTRTVDAVTPGAAVAPRVNERAGDSPTRAIIVDDARVPLLPDGALAVTIGSGGGHDGFARKIAQSGHALTFTGLTVTFPDVALTNGGLDARALTASASDRDLAPHDRFTSDPNAAHAPLGDAAPDRASADATTTRSASDASVNAASARATASAPTLALAAKAALAAAAVSVPALLGWTLYHRLRGPAVLNNKTRKAIYDAIMSEPGIGVQELSERMSVSYSTTTYHLTRLQNARMIVPSQDGNKLRYYKNGGAFNEHERHVLPLLKNREVLRVLSLILENPGTYRAEIAARMGVTATTVNWHLRRLVKHDLVLEHRQGRSAHLYVDQSLLTEHLEPLVPKLKEADADLATIAERLVGAAHAHPSHSITPTDSPASA